MAARGLSNHRRTPAVTLCVQLLAYILVTGSHGQQDAMRTRTETAALMSFKRGLTNQAPLERLDSAWTGVACSAANLSTWQGVTCTNGRVTALDLTALRLAGTLSESLSGMAGLTSVNLAKNNFTGTLPAGWSSMAALTSLELGENNLTGPLPEAWSNLTALTSLSIHDNNLTGTLPNSWASLTALGSLELYVNSLTGPLPASWVNLTSLSFLALIQNKLNGTVLPSWKAMPNMTTCMLGRNELTGTIPTEWSEMPKLTTVHLAACKLTGTLPDSWKNLTDANYIHLANNQLAGSLPPSWSRLTAMSSFFLHNNTLTGSLPSEWSGMSSLSYILLSNNNFTGSLPASWSNMSQLYMINVSSNSLSGTLPQAWSNLTMLSSIDLCNCNLSGTIPGSWSDLTALASLNLTNNHIAGPLTAITPKMSSLRSVQLPLNNLSGSLPSNWAQMSLMFINLSRNALTGTVPPEMLSAGYALSSSASFLDLSYNALHGGLPPSVAGNFLPGNSSDGQGAPVTLAPMTNPGLCGSVPSGMNAISATGSPLRGLLPAGACPDPEAQKKKIVISAATIGGALLAAMAAWAIVACARSMRSGPSTRLSRSTLLQLGASSEHNLKFELDKQGNPLLLGKGGFGEVYKARWHGTLVAVKALISDEAPKVAAFQHECRILESLHHTHIVHHYDSLVGEEGTMYLITEYMQGGDLGGKLRSDKAEPRQYSWYQHGRFVLLGIIRGLVYLHSKRIVWFDCKPGNVLLDHTGRVAKIADFGMARILESTFITGVLGTPGYIAPELQGCADGDEHPLFRGNAAVDVYGFGQLLYQVLTAESLQQGAKRLPRAPEECPQSVVDLYLACVSFKPGSRPTAVQAMQVIEDAMLVIPGAIDPSPKQHK